MLVDDTAHFIASTANVFTAFNADPSVVLDEYVDRATTEEGLDPNEGWVVDASQEDSATISLTQGGETCTASIRIVSGSARSAPPTGTCNQGSLVSTPTFTLDVDAASNVLFTDLRENVNTNKYRIVNGSLFSIVSTHRTYFATQSPSPHPMNPMTSQSPPLRTETFTRRSDEFAVSCVAKVSFAPPTADAEDDSYRLSVTIAYCEKERIRP